MKLSGLLIGAVVVNSTAVAAADLLDNDMVHQLKRGVDPKYQQFKRMFDQRQNGAVPKLVQSLQQIRNDQNWLEARDKNFVPPYAKSGGASGHAGARLAADLREVFSKRDLEWGPAFMAAGLFGGRKQDSDEQGGDAAAQLFHNMKAVYSPESSGGGLIDRVKGLFGRADQADQPDFVPVRQGQQWEDAEQLGGQRQNPPVAQPSKEQIGMLFGQTPDQRDAQKTFGKDDGHSVHRLYQAVTNEGRGKLDDHTKRGVQEFCKKVLANANSDDTIPDFCKRGLGESEESPAKPEQLREKIRQAEEKARMEYEHLKRGMSGKSYRLREAVQAVRKGPIHDSNGDTLDLAAVDKTYHLLDAAKMIYGGDTQKREVSPGAASKYHDGKTYSLKNLVMAVNNQSGLLNQIDPLQWLGKLLTGDFGALFGSGKKYGSGHKMLVENGDNDGNNLAARGSEDEEDGYALKNLVSAITEDSGFFSKADPLGWLGRIISGDWRGMWGPAGKFGGGHMFVEDGGEHHQAEEQSGQQPDPPQAGPQVAQQVGRPPNDGHHHHNGDLQERSRFYEIENINADDADAEPHGSAQYRRRGLKHAQEQSQLQLGGNGQGQISNIGPASVPDGVVRASMKKKKVTSAPGVRELLARRAAATAGTSSASVVNTQLKNIVDFYTLSVSVGTPPQDLEVLVDTGSSDMWMYAPGAPSVKTIPTFDVTKSHTWHANNSQFKIRYVSGSANGEWGTDDVVMNGAKIKGQSVAVVNRGVTLDGVPGLLGVGLPEVESTTQKYSNVPLNMYYQGHTKTPTFSLYLDSMEANYGSLLFGGIDHAKYKPPLILLPRASRSQYTVACEIGVNNQLFRLSVLLDSGTTLGVLPNRVLRQMATYWGLVFDSQTRTYYTDNASHMPNVPMSFTFSGQPYALYPRDLLIATHLIDSSAPKRRYSLGFTSSEENGRAIILGDVFLRHFYVVYDLARAQIAIAEASFDHRKEEIEAITGPDIPRATRAPKFSKTGLASWFSQFGLKGPWQKRAEGEFGRDKYGIEYFDGHDYTNTFTEDRLDLLQP